MDETTKEIRDLRMDFNTLNINMTNFIKVHESQMEEIRGRQKDHHENIYGTATTPGLRMDMLTNANAINNAIKAANVEIERIKGDEKTRKGSLITIGIGLVMLALTTLWKLITGK